MFKQKTQFAALLCAASFASVLSVEAWAVPSASAFGTEYQPGVKVGSEQVQVIYYRAVEPVPAPGAAHVYVDREFHTGLLPGGYTRFCVAPGKHLLGSYLDDAPLYLGKSGETFEANFEIGKTYFVRVNGSSMPHAVASEEAERELRDSRAQVHTLSRASRVDDCHYQLDTAVTYKDYTLSGDVLFAFGKSGYGDITRQGHYAIRELVGQLLRDAVQPQHVEVIGHTDPIGSAAANRALGLKRAQTVRRLLVEGGLPANKVGAVSAGSHELLVADCVGSRTEQVACYAPNRRVVVRVDLTPI